MSGYAIAEGFSPGLLFYSKQAEGALVEPEASQENTYPTETQGNSRDVEILARTMWGEARNEGTIGMQAVANVVMNRLKKAPRFGSSVAEVCLKPYQFSVWNKGDPNLAPMKNVTDADPRFREALELANRAVNGDLRDVTSGADHYLNIAFTMEIRGGSLPAWVDMTKQTASIGQHTFLKLG